MTEVTNIAMYTAISRVYMVFQTAVKYMKPNNKPNSPVVKIFIHHRLIIKINNT